MIRRCSENSGAREIDVEHRDAICVARFELFGFGHERERLPPVYQARLFMHAKCPIQRTDWKLSGGSRSPTPSAQRL